MGFGVIFFWGGGAKTFGGKVHPSLELRVFTFRHLWSRSDASCMSIAICLGETLGKFGDHQLPYQKSKKNCAA